MRAHVARQSGAGDLLARVWGNMIKIASGPAEALGGTPTSTRTTASTINVTMTIVMLIALPPLVYYMWFCLAFNHGQLMLPSVEMLEHFPLPTTTSVAIVVGWLVFQG